MCYTFCNAGFVTKLDPAGTLLYSTLLGSGQILPKTLVIDANGNALTAGLVADDTLHTVNPYQPTYTGGLCTSCYSAYFAKLNSNGTAYLFSSFLGSGNMASAAATDSAGNIYIAGKADSVYGATVPLKGELQSGNGPFFLSKFSPDGKNLLFGTIFGGYTFSNTGNSIAGMAVGGDGTIYLGGNTGAAGFPYTLNAGGQPSGIPSNPRMFAMAFNPSLFDLKYATDLGDGSMAGMTVDAAGNFYAAFSSGAEPVLPSNAVVADQRSGGFFLKLDSAGNRVQTSGFSGLITSENPTAIAVDSSGNIYLAGGTGNSNNPFVSGCNSSDPIAVGPSAIPTPPTTSCSGGVTNQSFIAKIAPDARSQISVGQLLPFISLHNVGSADLNISSIVLSGNLNKVGGTCGNKVLAGTSCILTLADGNGKLAQGSFTINSDASPSSQTFTPYLDPRTVGGQVGDYLFVDSSQLHFRPQFAGTASPPQPLRIWNAGFVNMTLTSITATPYLTQTNNCPGTLAPGASCALQVAWDTNSAYQADSIRIAYDNNPPLDTYIYGPYNISPTALMLSQAYGIPFANETQGNPFFYRTINVTNVSSSPVEVPQAAVTGDSAFSIVGNTCSGSLGVQQNCVVAVALDSVFPAGQHIGYLNFSGTLSASLQLSGNIILPLAITPSSYQLNLGSVSYGNSSSQDLTLTNTSTAPVSIQSLQHSISDYSETDNCLVSALAGGASCTVHITFQPQVSGARRDTLVVNLGTSMNPLQIFLIGSGNFPLAPAPSFSLAGGTYNLPQNLVLTDSLPGATIHYTYNSPGIPPTIYDMTYNGPVYIGSTGVVQAIATSPGYAPSYISSKSYVVQILPPASAPFFNLPGGTYHSQQLLTLTDSTPGASIHYTTNGTTPTAASNLYTGPITIASTGTIQAVAIATGYSLSPVSGKSYIWAPYPPASVPAFTLAGGTYHTPQALTLTDATPGATIYYTTNGTTPTTGSALYSAPITIASTETVEAAAIAPGFSLSPVSSKVYTYSPLPLASAPSFSLAGGHYTTPQTLTITDSTPGAAIYYTTNGTMPTTASNHYTSPITISTSETVIAIAVASGYTNSNPASKAYTIP